MSTVDPKAVVSREGSQRSLQRELLSHSRRGGPPSRSRQIFVNRALRLEKIRFVGFDLDWTLAHYHAPAIDELTFDLTLERLIDQHGFPAAVRAAEFRPDFPHRGLIVDRREGTVLKMNRHRYVARAYLGRAELGTEDRTRLYRRRRLDLTSQRFYWVDTLFELPEVNVFSELVELGQRGTTLPTDSHEDLFTAVREAIDAIHADGTLKNRVADDLPTFLPRSPELALALERLRLHGRRLVLITNSALSYTDRVCSYLFSGALPGLDSWRQLFALVIVSADKPRFFRDRRPFVSLGEDGEPGERVDIPRWSGLYAGGSQRGLMKLLGCLGEEVLYVGDHIYGDVVSSKRATTWRTALVVRELEEEIEAREQLSAQIDRLEAVKDELASTGLLMDDLRDVLYLANRLDVDDEKAALRERRERLLTLQRDHRELRQRARELETRIEARFNPTWGSVFKLGGSKSLFGSQVDHFACLYTSRVENFLGYGSSHYFRVLHDPMSHEHDV